MKLFEFQDLGALRTALELRRDQAANSEPPASANVSAGEFARMVIALGLAVPKSEEGKIAFKNAVDAQGTLIDKINPDGSVILKTSAQTDAAPPADTGNKTVDGMASDAAKYKPYGS